jgi:glycine/D-amino acid oxidase-like deaminating enzyme
MTAASLEAATSRPLWWDGVEMAERAPLDRSLDADVVVVGAGYTGLWAAHSLLELDPALSTVVLERRHVGFGASGRNGGWCYDGFAAGIERIEAMSDVATARRWADVVKETVDVVGATLAGEGIDCDFHKGGSIEFLRNGGQQARAAEHVEVARRFGWTEQDLRLIGPGEAAEVARAAGRPPALWSAHTAALHPARLVHGLAAAVERRGARIFEGTGVSAIEPGVVRTEGGYEVRAGAVVRATEGYTSELLGRRRELAPLYSLMIATEPLPAGLWEEIGLAGRQTFGDLRHLVIYGQRTADGRIAFGGRGAPYDYGSRIRANAEFPAQAFTQVREALVDVFPQLADVAISHRWGGVLGVSRTWMPTVGFDRATGVGWAGGYVGSGVAATNLAGRTLAALITGSDSPLVRFPWVNRRVRGWEPEPFRWIGINAALRVMKSADRVEERTGREARRAGLLWRVATR